MRSAMRWIVTGWVSIILCSVCFAEMRAWTSNAGETVVAQYVEVQDGLVVLEMEGGHQVRVRFDDLRARCRRYIEDRVAVREEAGVSAESLEQRQRAIRDLFGRRFLDPTGRETMTEVLAQNEKIGVYFSAKWCAPCRNFTPHLVRAYTQWKEDGKPIEMVYVSSDQNHREMQDYMQEYGMRFFAIGPGDAAGVELKNRFEVRGIPRLVIIDTYGNILSENAVRDVGGSGHNAYDRW